MREPFVLGTHDANTLVQLADVASRAEYSALMADGHLGYVMPIGGVAAYRDKISVTGVGFDIACGNCAIQTDRRISSFDRCDLEALADEIQSSISFGVGRKNNAYDAPLSHSLFDAPEWDAIPSQHRDTLRDKARTQLGTVGSGNHYVDVLSDADGLIWVGVHFGSRGLGHTIASGFLALSADRQWREKVPETEALLDLTQPLGQDYFSLMELAGRYAYAGREWVARKVVSMLGAQEIDLVHNHHNFAWRETHFEEDLIVVRKGATPAFPRQRGFVGGSMGDTSVILEGADLAANHGAHAQQLASLFSTVHGAGRVMSRTEAAGKRNRKTGEIKKEGRVTPEMMNTWLEKEGVILRGGGLDESPHVYRRLPDVLDAQGDTIKITHWLNPEIVVMAGANEFDPYKD